MLTRDQSWQRGGRRAHTVCSLQISFPFSKSMDASFTQSAVMLEKPTFGVYRLVVYFISWTKLCCNRSVCNCVFSYRVKQSKD